MARLATISSVTAAKMNVFNNNNNTIEIFRAKEIKEQHYPTAAAILFGIEVQKGVYMLVGIFICLFQLVNI